MVARLKDSGVLSGARVGTIHAGTQSKKAYMTIPSTASGQRAASMTLLALETLPCGCVAGIYQARPTVVEVEFVEAKGPHCVFSRHRSGHVTRLGVPDSMVAETGEPLV
jgi:hypothetical protein